MYDKSRNLYIYVLFILSFCRRIGFKKDLLLYFLHFQISGAVNWFSTKIQLFGGFFVQGQLEIEAKTLKIIVEFF